MALQSLQLEHGVRNGKEVIFIRFPFNQEIINRIKNLGGCRWSGSERVWYAGWSEEKLKQLTDELSVLAEVRVTGKAGVEAVQLKSVQDSTKVEVVQLEGVYDSLFADKLLRFENWMRSKRLAESTIKTYCAAMRVFLMFFRDKKPEEITCDDIIRFNNEYLISKKKSHAYQTQMVSAIKKFFTVIENKVLKLELIHRPKPEHNIPHVISMEDIKAMLDLIKNLKHRTMLSLIYACGLRRGELIALKESHIDFNRKVLLINKSKGKKDRIVPLGEKLLS